MITRLLQPLLGVGIIMGAIVGGISYAIVSLIASSVAGIVLRHFLLPPWRYPNYLDWDRQRISNYFG